MIIVVVGPTGVGKTKLSLELAKRFNAEVINADSMQVYKDLNIGTAKIKEEEKEGIPHHLFDIVNAEDDFSVYDYQKLGREKIKEIESKNKNIIIVGGTGLYIKALLYDYNFTKEENKHDFSNLSNDELINKIKEYDEKIEIDFNNRRRLERTLTKLKENNEFTNNKDKELYKFKIVGLTTDRLNLYERIDKRVLEMMNEGLLEEAKSLYSKRNSKSLLTAIGYKELFKYFDNECILEDAISLIQKNSRHYAKRQYTFFNNQFKNNELHWFNTNYENFDETIDEVYNYLLEK